MRTPALDFKRTAFGATLLFALLTLSACASAPAPFDPLPLGRSVIAPTGFVQFCQRRPDQCAAVEPVTEHRAVREPSTPDPAGRVELSRFVIQLPEATDIEVLTPQTQADHDGIWPDTRVTLPGDRLVLEPVAGPPQIGARSGSDFVDRLKLSVLAFQPAEIVDARPGPRIALLDYRPNATSPNVVSPPRDVAVDIDPWKAIETSPPMADQPSRKVYSVISRDALGARLHLSAGLQAEIATVDVAINRAITPRTDLEAFGVDNYWTLPLTDGPKPEGNCKHYALEKRRQLVADGVPPDALSMAIVTTPANEVHAVLVISTDQGDLVLDNLTDAVRPWRQTDYRWLVRQTPAAPLHWVEAG